MARLSLQSARVTFFLCVVLLSGCAQSEFRSEFPSGFERIWVGPEYFANRMLDWRVRDGRLECMEGSKAKPLRTVHLLSHAIGPTGGGFRMSVRTGPIEPGPAHAATWSGFLIGVGGEHVDWRVSALCHHWPGEDGGLLAVVDGLGRVAFRDNSHRAGPRGPRPNIPPAAWPLLSGEESGPGQASGDMTLTLDVRPEGDGFVATLAAKDSTTGRLIHQVIRHGVPREQVDGNVAVISHGSPKSSGKGAWFRDWTLAGPQVRATPDHTFGPVLAAQHTLSDRTLKMTAQFGPLGAADTQEALLDVERHGEWSTVARGKLLPRSFTVPFRVPEWDGSSDVPYRIRYDLRTGPEAVRSCEYLGTVRRIPASRSEFVVAAFTGHHISAEGQGHWNGDHIWYPHNELVGAVMHHRPDLLFFSGDQIYEGGLAGIVRSPPDQAIIDYHYHWIRWCWAFRDLARDIPCVCVPDDHDVYHGNIWGAGGRAATGPFALKSDNGGYMMDPLFVNAVHATQTSHLPDPVDHAPIEQGISVYHTRLEYAGMSFAIIADRMFKSSPSVTVPEGQCKNGWFLAPDFDPRTQSDVPSAVLLGERQLRFLDGWVSDWSRGAWMKVLLSQTIFANVATLPKPAANDAVVPSLRYAKEGEYVEDDKVAADADSNGWPRSGRQHALRVLRRGFTFHIAGDQHLGSFIQYGVDTWNDASYALCVPSIANVWPRRWFPPEPGARRRDGAPKYTGEFLDGFGNHMTVHAVANPVKSGVKPEALYDRCPGYGIVRFHRTTRQITSEVWPRWVDPKKSDARQYLGWPITVGQEDNYGRKAKAWLPEILVLGSSEPVFQVAESRSGEILYTIRAATPRFRPKVFDGAKTYTVRVGEPGTLRWIERAGLRPTADPVGTLTITLPK